MKKLIIASVILVIGLGCAGLFWFQTKGSMFKKGNREGTATRHVYNDPTGVCYRRIQWSQGGELHSRYEVVLVKQSSSLEKDMKRLKDLESTTYYFKNPDTTPFNWIGALFDDNYASFGTGDLDCSSLPTIVESNQ